MNVRVTEPNRRQQIVAGIDALRDATRALRGSGAGRKGDAGEMERGALFDLAGLADRLASFAEDQGEDDWEQFWIVMRDIDTLRDHTAALAQAQSGLSSATIPALRTLITVLEPLVQSAP